MRRFASPALLAAAVAACAAVVYANALANGFALDDNFIIVGNARVHQLADLGRIWLTPYWPYYGVELGLYRPLAIFGYALQWAAGGGEPWLFHAVSILLHALVSTLGFLVLRRLVPPLAALAGALVFAVHPVHTEVVANVVGQAELIAAAATLGACLLLLTRPPGPAVSWPRRMALVALFAIGMLAKENAIVLPGLLVVLEFVQGRVALDRRAAAAWARALAMPLFLLAATATAYLILRIDVLGSIGGVDAAPNLPYLRLQQEHRILSGLRAWPEYVRLLVFPADLSADYSPAVILPVESVTPMALLGAGIMVGIFALALLTPWFPAAGVPAAWFVVTILPVSNLLMPIGVLVAERILYTPSFAVALAVAFAWQALARSAASLGRRRLAAAAVAVAVLLMGARTWTRNPDWKDTPAVWDALVRDHPESYRAQWVNGSRQFMAGNAEAGTKYMEIAYRLWPDDAALINELAFEYLGLNEFDRAVELLERSRRLVRFISRTDVLLGHAYIGAGQPARALEALERADRAGADRNMLYPLWAQAWERSGRLDRAIAAWRATVRQPLGSFATYWTLLARALARDGRQSEALAAADTAALLLKPGDIATADRLPLVRRAIEDGCYHLDPPGRPPDPRRAEVPVRPGCEDPLADWYVVIPILVADYANGLQNATPHPPRGGDQAAGGQP